MGKDTARIILVIGALVLAYYTLKSWGIIGPFASPQQLSNKSKQEQLTLKNWKPLTTEQLNQLRLALDNNPISIVRRP